MRPPASPFAPLLAPLLALLIAAGAAALSRRDRRPDPFVSMLAADSVLSAEVRAGGPGALLPRLHDDAVVLLPERPILHGGDSIAQLLSRDAERFGWTAARAGIARDGRFGYTMGSTRSVEGAARHGKYVAVWELAEGGWRVVAFMRNGGRTDAALTEEFRRALPASCISGADRATAERAIEAADAAFSAHSVRHGTRAAFLAYAAADAALMRNPDIAYGREVIGTLFADTSVALEWWPRHARAASSGDLGVTVGEAVSTGRDPEGRERRGYSKYLTVWRWDCSARRWLFAVDGGNPRPAP